jgi:hypothetical protein
LPPSCLLGIINRRQPGVRQRRRERCIFREGLQACFTSSGARQPEANRTVRAPHFVRLAQIDEMHFIAACRQGLVHLTWGRSTLRLLRDEFRQLVALLERVESDGDFWIRFRPEDPCELQMGALILLLTAEEFRQFSQAAQQAMAQLDRFLASGVWDQEETPETQTNPFDQLRQIPFSQN